MRNKEKRIAAKKKLLSVFILMLLLVITIPVLIGSFVLPSLFGTVSESKNILIVSSKMDVASNFIYLAHISDNPDSNKVYPVEINQKISVPEGYGEYALSSVYPLLIIDKKDSQFINSVFSQIFGVTIDAVVVVDKNFVDVSDLETERDFLLQAYAELKKSNIRIQDYLLLHYQLKQVQLNKQLSLEDMDTHYTSIPSVTGTVAKYCPVAVVNSTGRNGIATQFGKIIENSGFIVVRTDEAESELQKTTIFYQDGTVTCEQAAKKLGTIFPVQSDIKQLSELENGQQFRASIVVFITQ